MTGLRPGSAPPDPNAVVRIDAVGHVFETRRAHVEAVRGVTLDVAPGEFVAIVGSSGCGKSTLMRIIAGLIEPTEGVVQVTPDMARRGGIGMVFQRPVLLPWRTVRRNVLVPSEVLRLDRGASRTRADALLEQVGLTGFGDALPGELSGGMQQRVALCRALLPDPPLLLMDEPFGALDAITREQMNRDLQELWLATGKTVLLVTHSIEEAVFLAGRVVVMTPRPGTIADIVEIDLERPRTFDTMATSEFAGLCGHVRSQIVRLSGAA